MNKNFKIIIEYDGSEFFGWQKQKDQKTIQGEIEKGLSLILNQEIKIFGSGRTDAGVHALGQVANFHARTRILPLQLKKAMNSLIKYPIVIQDCTIVEDDFHARYKAVSKEYHYFILNRENPCAIFRQYQWHIREPLNLTAMKKCCKIICGTMDFTSFENSGSPRSSGIRTVFSAKIEPLSHNRIVFKICASGFLRYMVRNLMGTIILAGRNKITPDRFSQILEKKDRTQAGAAAPALGLFLKKVNYS